MLAFTLDVGSRTQDFMLFDSNENPRNFVRAVLPSPTVIIGEKVRKLANLGKDVFLTGYTMGGGAVSKAVKEAVRKVRVYSTEKAALTIDDDIERVKELGVIVTESGRGEKVILKDVFLESYEKFLESFSLEIPEIVAVAVQDHGFSPKVSNRVFRFQKVEELLKKHGTIYSLIFDEKSVPEFFNRMRSVVESVKDYGEKVGRDFRVYVADTSFAAVAGCMLSATNFPALLINFGNSHTVGAIVEKDGEVCSIFEHHTRILANLDFHEFLKKFVEGEITNELVLKQGGHGAFVKEVVDVKEILATGPNAKLFGFREVAPLGDVMTVGNAGLIKMLGENGELAGI